MTPVAAGTPLAASMATTTTIQPPPPPTSFPASVDYGIFDRSSLRSAGEKLSAAVQRLADRLSDAMEQTTDLEVKTYVATNVSAAIANPDQAGKLVAYTHLTWAGDTTLIVPEQPDQLSELLVTLHDKTVEQARASKVSHARGRGQGC